MGDDTLNSLRESLPYRDCAGIALFNRQGKVMIGKRSGLETQEFAWQLPQGGIDGDEEPLDAAIRELYEETSITSISVLTAAPDWIFYDLPDEVLGTGLRGKYRGQRQKWFAFLFEGEDSEINVTEPGGGKFPSEFSEWRWEALEKITELVVPFKRDAYAQIVAAFKHVPAAIPNLDAGLAPEGDA